MPVVVVMRVVHQMAQSEAVGTVVRRQAHHQLRPARQNKQQIGCDIHWPDYPGSSRGLLQRIGLACSG